MNALSNLDRRQEDRRHHTAEISPDRRLEDVRKAAQDALERLDREAAELKRAFQAAHENDYGRAAS